ncbi:hypothetical protein BST97_12205 [Nonlabens spongiae]|uniref:DUF547 domain-containing protein n=1 Tax=Nonlabens spongiae TaxID=331648 RepID=A0A1W6MM99_9FLAO|nr:DUF547 domain-containing protein [Nonlabens spongiae]ARN78692.1 hypothetical protein BST97_12205 [Nonlabens spongiae]
MKNLFSITLICLALFSSCIGSGDLHYAQLQQGEEISSQKGILDHSEWDGLLKKYVNKAGFVDYDGFQKDRQKLKDYLEYLNQNAPQKSWGLNEQFAFYINLYNAATVEIILENNQPASIKDIGSTVNPVWIQDFIRVDGKEYSLADIEKGVLQKMGDPRIHFAINCASYSCPKLQNTAFTAANVDELMDKSAREFVNSDKNDLSNSSNPKLSSIFKWYKGDFTDSGMTLIEYVNQYADKKINEGAQLDFKDYDWSLNKQ